MDVFRLDGRRILVTGASSGIGRACAVMAARLGAEVLLTARRKDALEATAGMLPEGAPCCIMPGDISSTEFVATLAERFGRIDGLVHAAGIGPMCPVGMQTAEHVEGVMRTNYLAFLELVKTYSRRKYRADKLSVVAVSSVAAKVGWAGVSAYAGSKGAVCASVRALAMELAPKGVRVNAVCPSNIRTPMFEAGAADMNGEESIRRILDKQPLGLGDPEQVAAPVCFLLSDAASFITGIDLPVDGGYLAQ